MTKAIPPATRAQYEDLTLQAMDDIANLIRAAQGLLGQYREFKKNPDLDQKAARSDVGKIVKTARCTARDLQRALFLNDKKRAGELSDTRLLWREDLAVAAELAKPLAEQEAAANPGVSNVIDVFVVRALEEMAARWGHTSSP